MGKLLFLVVVILCSGLHLPAQKVTKVKNAVGRWEVSGNLSMDEAEERAFLEAKKEALRKAGVMENVWSVFGQITQENGEEFQEAYSQMSTVAISGLVNVTRKEADVAWDAASKRLFKVVTIDAQVKKGEEEDRSYILEVKGIEPVYKESENFSCSFKLYGADSYIKFFWFDASGGALLYPNDFEKSQLFKTGEVYHFPISNQLDYAMEKVNKNASQEKVNLMIVATKTDIPFTGQVNYPNLLKWIYTIPVNQRCTFYQMILIK